MKRLITIGIISMALLLIGCNSIPQIDPMPPVDVAADVVLCNADTNGVVADNTFCGIDVNKVSQKLNSKEGYTGFGALGLAIVLTSLLIIFKRRKHYRR